MDEPLRRAFYEWLVYVSLPRGTRRKGRWERIRNFDEGLAMLAERLKQWRQESFEEGRREGLQKGLKQGMEQGVKQGMKQGDEARYEARYEARSRTRTSGGASGG
ncbi:MAG: hypothetical protein KatS3mg110_1259 [Pirellulaceae bacterium]|nr:MAG: hypothetical protein KatS3mg110_1259 [Pirellulaceae bacterium]